MKKLDKYKFYARMYFYEKINDSEVIIKNRCPHDINDMSQIVAFEFNNKLYNHKIWITEELLADKKALESYTFNEIKKYLVINCFDIVESFVIGR